MEENTIPKFQDLSIAPMHTCEHILNGTMVKLYGCERSRNAHIERKKSKINYELDAPLTSEQIEEVERRVNEVIRQDLPVTFEYVNRLEVPAGIPLDKLPEDASDTLRLVHIGDYDVCACIGGHVAHTAQLGQFKINSTSYRDGQFRIVFKLLDSSWPEK